MPLILAVEPDRRQGEAVATLAKNVLRSEVIVTESAEAAIAVMTQRVPDLLLTSLLLPPKDEAKIAERLRELDAAGTYVQTLVIPMLAFGTKKSADSTRNINRLWKGRAKASTPDGCAPEVFAGQISEYLRRAAAENIARARGEHAPPEHTESTDRAETSTPLGFDFFRRPQAKPHADQVVESSKPSRPVESAKSESAKKDRGAILLGPSEEKSAAEAHAVGQAGPHAKRRSPPPPSRTTATSLPRVQTVTEPPRTIAPIPQRADLRQPPSETTPAPPQNRVPPASPPIAASWPGEAVPPSDVVVAKSGAAEEGRPTVETRTESSVAHQPNVEPASPDEDDSGKSNSGRPMLVLGALDLGAFVEELTAAKSVEPRQAPTGT